MGSALMKGFLRFVVIGRIQRVIPAERKSPACEDGCVLDGAGVLDSHGRRGQAAFSPVNSGKKTRPPAEYDAHAALPCPDIEIGLTPPGKGIIARSCAGKCDPFHNRWKNYAEPVKANENAGLSAGLFGFVIPSHAS
jgi:hypothetical protein